MHGVGVSLGVESGFNWQGRWDAKEGWLAFGCWEIGQEREGGREKMKKRRKLVGLGWLGNGGEKEEKRKEERRRRNKEKKKRKRKKEKKEKERGKGLVGLGLD